MERPRFRRSELIPEILVARQKQAAFGGGFRENGIVGGGRIAFSSSPGLERVDVVALERLRGEFERGEEQSKLEAERGLAGVAAATGLEYRACTA